MNINQGITQTETREFMRQGFAGEPADQNPLNRSGDAINKAPQAKQVSTITVDGVDTLYVFTIDGVEYNFVTAAGTTAAVAIELRDFLRTFTVIGMVLSASVAASIVTLTGRTPGLSFALSETDDDLTAALVTAAVAAAPITFGRAVRSTGGFSVSNLPNSSEGTIRDAILAASASMTAQVDTWTLVDPTAGRLEASVSVPGVGEVTVSVPYNTSLTVSLDDLRDVLNGALADKGLDVYVVATKTATTLVLTAVFAGVEFESSVTSDQATYPSIVLTGTGVTLATSFLRSFIGMSKRSTDVKATVIGVAATAFPANSGVKLFEDGPMYISSTETPVYRGQVWVGLGVGEEGQLFASAAAGRLAVPRDVLRWERPGKTSENDNLAVARVKAQA